MSTTDAIANYTTEAEGLTFTFHPTYVAGAVKAFTVQASDGRDVAVVGDFALMGGGDSTFAAVGATRVLHLPRWTTTFQLVDQHLAQRVRINFARVAGRLF